MFVEPACDVHRAVPAAGAPDADRQLRFAFGQIARHQEIHHIEQSL
jgi:hypothetical protein